VELKKITIYFCICFYSVIHIFRFNNFIFKMVN
jgi:hypothetical protein